MRLILVQPQLRHSEPDDNFSRVRSCLDSNGIVPASDDVLLLPERIALTHERAEYEAHVRGLAQDLGCSVVGGSHHERRGERLVNAGMVVDAAGRELGLYEKVRPYAAERASVSPGERLGELSLGGRRVFVLICADFWFFDLFPRAEHLPDLILVPALSVSRKPTPDYSRSLWRHLAVARAYELGAFVGVSDWGHPSELPLLSASGVGGLADPTSTDANALFSPIASGGASVFPLDFEALDAFRRDRMERGFFWRHDGD